MELSEVQQIIAYVLPQPSLSDAFPRDAVHIDRPTVRYFV